MITLIDRGQLQKLANRKIFSGEKKKIVSVFPSLGKATPPRSGALLPICGAELSSDVCVTQTVAEVEVFAVIPNFICEFVILTPSRLRKSLKNNLP